MQTGNCKCFLGMKTGGYGTILVYHCDAAQYFIAIEDVCLTKFVSMKKEFLMLLPIDNCVNKT